MEDFFRKKFENLTDDQKESICKTLIMLGDSEFERNARMEYYAKTLKKMGQNVTIGAGVKIVNPQYVTLEDNVTICDDVTIIAREGTDIVIGERTCIKDRVYLDTEHADGYIHIENDVYIGTGTTLFGHLGLEIGDHVLMAQNITLTPYSHIFEDPDANIITQGGHSKKVTIGRDSYIGMRVAILYSGDIGEGSVIGAGSVVVKPIPPYSVAVGTPAKVMKKRA